MDEPQINPKGRAIPGLDYGIDMLDETPAPQRPASPLGSEGSFRSSAGSAPTPRPAAGGFQKPRFNFNQNQPTNFRPQSQPQQRFQEESMEDGSGGSGSYESGSGSEYSGSEESGGGLLNPDFEAGMQAQPLSYEERRQRKIEALAALRRLEEAGYLPAGDKQFSFASDLADIEDTVERLKIQRDLDSSIKYQRKFLIGFANVVEFVCSTEYNIFDLKLEGWSDSIFENINDYDEVFEELYYKYKDSVAIMPEIKLVMMVGGSAMMFHMSREIFSKTSSKVPGFDEVMSRDPELKRRYTDTAAGIAKERGMPMPSRQDNGRGFLNDMMKNFGPARPRQQQVSPQANPVSQVSQVNQVNQVNQVKRVPMSEPNDIDGLLGSLRGKGRGKAAQEEIDLSEIENLSDLA